MGIISLILSFTGFGLGLVAGLVIGYFVFIFSLPNDVKDPEVTSLSELDPKVLKRLLPELPVWVANPDIDRVDWLNKFLREMWPFLDKAVSKEVVAQVTPMLEQYRPKQIQSIEFETMSLGSLPPSFTGVKYLDTLDKEVILELALKWAGNPNIVIAVKAFGVKATVQVSELQLFAQTRVTLKPLVNVFPCFDRISVSLMQKPHVDFSLKVIGGDVMAIPGLYHKLQEMVKDIVAGMLLWPRTMVVYDQPTGSDTKKPVGFLMVSVLGAKGLKATDLLGKADPYVDVALGTGPLNRKKTAVCKKTLNPVWEPQNFRLIVVDPEKDELLVKIKDKDTVGADTTMGVAAVGVGSLVPEVPSDLWLDILKTLDKDDPANQKNRGQVHVILNYKPFREDEEGLALGDETGGSPTAAGEAGLDLKAPSGKAPEGGGLLRVIVHEGMEIEGKSHSNPNPYCKIRLRAETRTTKVVKKNSDPEWEEEFEFSLSEPPTNDILHVHVYSKHTMQIQKEVLGYVDIPLGDVVTNRRINDAYHLTDSKNGKIKIEVQWLTN